MKRTMYRALCAAAALALALLLAACGAAPKEETAQDAFSIRVRCEAKQVYQIFYTCYLNGEYYGKGGMANLDGGEITEDSELVLDFPQSFFENDADLSAFSIDFSPYGKEDTEEIATTPRVAIDAEYGKSYTIRFSGNEESGFKAELMR